MVKTEEQQFKNCIMQIYNDKCIISDRTYNLEVVHIKPSFLCNNYERYDVGNVLLLNCCVRRFFNDFFISIDPSTSKIKVKKTCKDKSLHTQNDKIIDNLSKSTLKYLEFHYNKFLESD